MGVAIKRWGMRVSPPLTTTTLLVDRRLDNLFLGQEIGMFLVRTVQNGIVLPQLGRQVSVGVSQGKENSLDEVTHGTGMTL
jgi:hypothetical protein